uniref:Thioredoxin domain-containing protein n=1 Tax=Candidatus Methanophaga sp. ANME-1 ERB7 TaxID=2759913 RepID=A0A7G9Z1Q8_9EURY|nr:hypothetical protein HDCMKPKE_00001 [Methanosarcinales archaeon ANME-1 ERB7]
MMKNKQVLSALLVAIIVFTIAASMAEATDSGGCPISSNPEVQPTDDPLNNRVDDLLAEDKTVFLFFYSDWCPYCHQQMPIIDELEEEYAGEVTFIQINVTARPDHAEEFGVSALPTMIVISGKEEEGYVREEISGFTEETELSAIIAPGCGDEPDATADAVIRATPPRSTTCNSCEDCNDKLKSGEYDVVTLTTDITDHEGSCIGLIMGESNVVFDCGGHTIDGDDFAIDPEHGVNMMHGTGNTIKNCVISDFSDGIYLWGATDHEITGNTVISNDEGIEMGWSDSNTIDGNIVNENYNGIVLSNSNSNTIDSNTVCKNTNSDFLIESGTGNSGDENVCDRPHGWNDAGTTGCTDGCSGTITCDSCADCSDKLSGMYDTVMLTTDIPNHAGTCITFGASDLVFDCDGHRIDGDDSGTDYGIYMSGKSGNTIKNCVVTDFHHGIYLTDSTGNTIYKNTANSNTGDGFHLSSSSGNTIAHFNEANSNDRYGIFLGSSSDNQVSFNEANLNDEVGIRLSNSGSNTITFNDVVDNKNQYAWGIYLYRSDSNIVSSNEVTNNYYGVKLDKSHSNTFDANTVCSNPGTDFDVVGGSSGNSGDHNTCDDPDGWNDAETTGCTHACEITSYSGTDRDDTIYFGYCDSCNGGSPGLLICRATDGSEYYYTIREMDGGILTIRGLDGDDIIKAVHCKTMADRKFGDFNNLTYSSIHIEGGDGNDCLFGSSGNQSLYGGSGDDYLTGYSGDDHLIGGSGNDFLCGSQGDDHLWGYGDDDILVGGTGDDYINGGSGRDTFRCRSAASVITKYDGADASTDCGDSTSPVSIEVTQQRDPYREWAYMTEHRNKITYHYLTTSNPALLLSDRAAGASFLISTGGDIPVAGDFDRDGFNDDIAIFRPSNRRWYYDYNHDASTDDIVGPWGVKGDRPVAGDFDRDGFNDDVAVFRPSDCIWYYDFNHDGSTNNRSGPWGLAGDIPIAGGFDRDGFNDDVAVFRPSNRIWYYDFNHNGSTNNRSGPWGLAGDIPVVGDFFYTRRNDDVAVFRPSNRIWYYDFNHDGSTDYTSRPWGLAGDIPIAGDFDSDGRCDDVAVFRLSNVTWYYDYNCDARTDPEPGYYYGPWGWCGEPLHTTHKQYPDSCGYTSLNMVTEYLGLADHTQHLYYSRDLDESANPVHMSEWGAGRAVDVGYHLSMEHIIYEASHKAREDNNSWVWKLNTFMDGNGRLNTSDGGTGSFYEIQYNIGHVVWNPATGTATGRVQKWLEYCPGVGFGRLSYVANKYSHGVEDARGLGATLGSAGNFADFNHLKAVIEGFIDHDIPLVLTVENGGHYNTLIGYWECGDDFYTYTADPLDGWGRPFYGKPMRWKKIRLTPDALPEGAAVVSGMILYGNSESSCASGGWAREIDRRFHSNILCVSPVPKTPQKGDLNGDGIVTTADAAIALELAASGECDPNPAADVNCDGQITSLDALMIVQAAAGNIELQGCELK